MQIPYTAWHQHSHCCVPVATAFEVSSAGINVVHDKKEAPAVKQLELGSTHRFVCGIASSYNSESKINYYSMIIVHTCTCYNCVWTCPHNEDFSIL